MRERETPPCQVMQDLNTPSQYSTSSQHIISIHTLNLPSQHTLSGHPLNTSSQFNRLIHPLSTSSQSILSISPPNTFSQFTLILHPLNASSQSSLFTLSIHLLNTSSQFTIFLHPLNLPDQYKRKYKCPLDLFPIHPLMCSLTHPLICSLSYTVDLSLPTQLHQDQQRQEQTLKKVQTVAMMQKDREMHKRRYSFHRVIVVNIRFNGN